MTDRLTRAIQGGVTIKQRGQTLGLDILDLTSSGLQEVSFFPNVEEDQGSTFGAILVVN